MKKDIYLDKKLSNRTGTARRAVLVNSAVSWTVGVRKVWNSKWLPRSFNGIGNGAIL